MMKNVNKKALIIIILVFIIVISILVFFRRSSYTITFLNYNKTVFAKKKIMQGEVISSPGIPEIPEGYIFGGWNIEISSINKDTEIMPICIEIPKEKNVIALSSGYGKIGNNLNLPLQLCGKVDISCFEIVISYDKDMLNFVAFENEDGNVVANCDSENGKIYINYISNGNTLGEVDLCDIVFSISNNKSSATDVTLLVQNAAKEINSDSFEKIECDVVNSKVYIGG